MVLSVARKKGDEMSKKKRSKKKRTIVRSATTGKFMKTDQAKKNPGGTVTEQA